MQLLANSISSQEKTQPRYEMKAISRLGWYPSILVFCHTFATINRIQNWVEPHHPSFALFVLHTISQSLTGALNCVAYGLNSAVRSAWFEKFPFLKALGACCGKQSNKFHKFENEMSTITDPSERDAELVPENGVGDEKPNSL